MLQDMIDRLVAPVTRFLTLEPNHSGPAQIVILEFDGVVFDSQVITY